MTIRLDIYTAQGMHVATIDMPERYVKDAVDCYIEHGFTVVCKSV